MKGKLDEANNTYKYECASTELNDIESWKTTCIKHHGGKLSVSQIGGSTEKGDQTKGNQILDELIVTKDTAEL